MNRSEKTFFELRNADVKVKWGFRGFGRGCFVIWKCDKGNKDALWFLFMLCVFEEGLVKICIEFIWIYLRWRWKLIAKENWLVVQTNGNACHSVCIVSTSRILYYAQFCFEKNATIFENIWCWKNAGNPADCALNYNNLRNVKSSWSKWIVIKDN